VLLFKKPFWEGLTSGAVTLTFRRWARPHVRPGGRYRCHPIGVLEVDRISLVRISDITEADAAKAGFAQRAGLVAYLGELGPVAETTEVYRVELHHGGDGDRVELALEATLTAADVEAIRGRLARLDEGTAWTRDTLALIDEHPRVAASKLAAMVGRETVPFKVDVRKLKKLGLTQSFEVGYEIAPRGRAFLDAVRATPRRESSDSGARPRRAPVRASRRSSPASRGRKPAAGTRR
jgi:hypothetical protein